MTCLFSSIKEIFTGQPLISFQGGACKAIKSVFIDPSHVYRTAIKNKVKNWSVFQDDTSNGEDFASLRAERFARA